MVSNIGMEYINLFRQAENSSNVQKNNLLDELDSQNNNLKDISVLISAITERKKTGKADFIGEPKFMDLIDKIRENNIDPSTGQSIIPSHQYEWSDEKSIDIVLQGLSDHVKIIGQQANKITMLIQQEYHDMNSITESARKFIEMINESIRSIQNRTGR